MALTKKQRADRRGDEARCDRCTGSARPRIIGVDPAYSGVDDAVIYLRQGLHTKVLWTGNKTTDDLIMAKLIKRGEMFNACKTWLNLGGALDDQETADDLAAAEYKVRVDGKIVMEPKEDIKERLGRSPVKGDALFLTFACR